MSWQINDMNRSILRQCVLGEKPCSTVATETVNKNGRYATPLPDGQHIEIVGAAGQNPRDYLPGDR